PSYRHLRHLVQLRDTCVRQAQADKARIKALLLYEGLAFPETSGKESWSSTVMVKLDALGCAPVVRFKLDRLLSNLRFAQEQTHQTLKAIREFCKRDSDIARCMAFVQSVP